MLKIYNSLTRQKEPFRPIVPGKVRIYVCGMTVYDYCHLGHARVMIVFDVVVRYLRSRGFDVTYVRNITDIDDKIIQRAKANGEDFRALTERFIAAMHADAAALHIEPPDIEPRATASMHQIIALISVLLEKGYAYRATSGDVFYRIARFPGYGRLSGKAVAELRAGERIAADEAKEDPLDFVLWKAAKAEEPSWSSPWGSGRPGWHIECSAMSMDCLGPHFDIHGGGMDLQFPHHDNEIAQSEAATGEPFVNVWMHNGFVRVAEEKMSKSAGNFFTVREILARYRPEEVRYFILASHYRSPLNYGDDQLENARGALSRLYNALRGVPSAPPSRASLYADVVRAYNARFQMAMDDDFATPEALAVLFDVAREINRARGADNERAVALGKCLQELGGVLGLLVDDPDEYLQSSTAARAERSDQEIESLVVARQHARTNRDWAEADRIRDLLKGEGVALEDGPDGTRWRRT